VWLGFGFASYHPDFIVFWDQRHLFLAELQKWGAVAGADRVDDFWDSPVHLCIEDGLRHFFALRSLDLFG
jgi:hypothetical protein